MNLNKRFMEFSKTFLVGLDTFFYKKITSYSASACSGNEINDIEVYDTDEEL